MTSTPPVPTGSSPCRMMRSPAAIRAYFTDIHTLAEGAGAAPLAALMQESERMKGKKVGVILGGGNIDSGWFAKVLQGQTPTP